MKTGEKKKILFKLWQFPHLSETFITAQIITAIKADLDVYILVGELLDFEKSKQEELINKYNLNEKIILQDFKIPKNKLFRLIKCFFLLPKLILNIKSFCGYLKSQKKFSLGWIYRFNFYLNFKDFEIIHIQYGTNVKPIDVLKRVGLIKGKIIVSFHGHDAFFPLNGLIENNGYYNDLFKENNIIVANTPYLANKILELNCPTANLRIIPVGIDTEYFKGDSISFTGNKLKLINVGRLDAVKGHKYAIEIVRKLIAKGRNVTLTIIGEGIERKQIEKQIRDNDLNNYIKLLGSKSQEEIRLELLKHHAYLFCAVPLKNGRRETQGLATLEAQSCGLPAIVFNSGGVKYTVDNDKSGFICDEYDVECVLGKIEQLIDNPVRYREMSDYARHFVKSNFDNKVLDKDWDSLYSEFTY